MMLPIIQYDIVRFRVKLFQDTWVKRVPGPSTSRPFPVVFATNGRAHSGWGQAACVGDYDNDGWTDLCVTYYGKIVLYRNNGGRTLDDVSEKARIGGAGRWNTGCTFLDYDGDGYLDLFVANYIDYGDAVRYDPGSGPNCIWKGVPVVCGPTGLKHASNL